VHAKRLRSAAGHPEVVPPPSADQRGVVGDDNGRPADLQTIEFMLAEMKCKWTGVCNKSVDRQKDLEDAMLLAGQFKDALQLLIDWLYKVEPTLAEGLRVQGDRDTVSSLIEAHKV